METHTHDSNTIYFYQLHWDDLKLTSIECSYTFKALDYTHYQTPKFCTSLFLCINKNSQRSIIRHCCTMISVQLGY